MMAGLLPYIIRFIVFLLVKCMAAQAGPGHTLPDEGEDFFNFLCFLYIYIYIYNSLYTYFITSNSFKLVEVDIYTFRSVLKYVKEKYTK